jgi:hypothetical protein
MVVFHPRMLARTLGLPDVGDRHCFVAPWVLHLRQPGCGAFTPLSPGTARMHHFTRLHLSMHSYTCGGQGLHAVSGRLGWQATLSDPVSLIALAKKRNPWPPRGRDVYMIIHCPCMSMYLSYECTFIQPVPTSGAAGWLPVNVGSGYAAIEWSAIHTANLAFLLEEKNLMTRGGQVLDAG